MNIRPAQAADVPGIAEVHVLGWQLGYRGLLPQDVLDALRPAHRVPRWTATIERASWPHAGTLVADAGTMIVGFADLRPESAAVGELASFYVRPAMWRQGVGSALMAAVLDTFRAARRTAATLWVQDTNERAQRFYRSHGWYPDGTSRPDTVGAMKIHDLRYRRALGSER
jgi:GNAT superfamily N-acetyltransferase